MLFELSNHFCSMKKIITSLFLLIAVVVCFAQYTIPDTIWRAELIRQDGQVIPFIFETKQRGTQKIIYFSNAEEKILADSVLISADSVYIQMPFFDSRIEAVLLRNGTLQGEWKKRLEKETKSIPFVATPGNTQRFTTSGNISALYNIEGRWAVNFIKSGNTDTTVAVGEFMQKGNIISGTFLTATGDYRYLEGIIDTDSMRLSCFDGGHAFLFTAKVNSDSAITGGCYYSGAAYMETWTAQKNKDARLPDEYAVTKLKKGNTKLSFTFKSIDGTLVSFTDKRFKNKVLLVQVMGSWCPNCMDETQFLSAFYNNQKNKQVEVISLAYERSTDFERSQKNVRAFQKRFDVKYPMLITGVTVNDTLRTEKTLPQLEKILGFPTLLFVDKKGYIRKIHTGFTGPGTGEHYQLFKDDFYKIIEQLMNE